MTVLAKIFEDSDKFIEKVEKNSMHLNFLHLKYIIYIYVEDTHFLNLWDFLLLSD